MSIAATLLLSAALTLQPDSNLRLYNPYGEPANAAVRCGGATRLLQVAPRDAADAGPCADASVDAPLPLLALETRVEDGVETQRVAGVNSGCETFAVEAPLFSCARTNVTVAAPFVPGAVYSWSVTGATVVSGHGTNQLVLSVGEGPSVHVSATITGACASAAEAVIAVRSPLIIDKLEVPQTAAANTPVTIQWSYAGEGVPGSQLLTGDAFDAPVVLGADARSYSWTPAVAGTVKVELQASYASSISTKPAARRRPSAKSRASAAPCPSARKSVDVDVRGCTTRPVSIIAPDSVEAGQTFNASVTLRTGETAKWTVTQGVILTGTNSDTVTVKAGESGDLTLRVAVTAGPDCITNARASVAIQPRAVCSTTAPTAALSVENQGCDVVTVKATFTGTPPFSGMWIDGRTFQTSERSLTHEFTTPGTYTIRNFRDALCAGTVTGTARVAVFPPNVTLTSNGSCPGSTVTATFVGTPPFEGRWSDGESFTTTGMTLQRKADSSLQMMWYRDSACPKARSGSNRIDIIEPAAGYLPVRSFCSTGPTFWIPVYFDGGRGTYSVHWSDGGVSSATSTEDGRTVVVREYRTTTGFDHTLSIVRVTGPTCEARLNGSPTVKMTMRPAPQVDYSKSNVATCVGQTQKIVLKPGLHPDAKLNWTVHDGTILSGQGTPELTFVQNVKTEKGVTVTATYPDGECTLPATFVSTHLSLPGRILQFTADRTSIKAGGSINVTVEIDEEIEHYSVQVAPAARANTFPLSRGVCTGPQGRKCTYVWTDTYGPGPVTMTLSAGNDCGSTSAQLSFEVIP